MPKFIYTARIKPLQTIEGEIEAESQQDALNKLIKLGYFTLTIHPENSISEKRDFLGFHKISHSDIVIFTRQLSSLIESGVNILNGLNIIAGQSPNKYLKYLLQDIAVKIKDGRSLSDSLSMYPRIFSGLYAAMIRSGELGGELEQALKRLADFLEKEDEFKNSVRAALIYPAFIFAVSALTIIVLLGFVIPRLVSMFEDMGQILPLPTRILIEMSTFLRGWGWLIVLVICAFLFFWQRLRHNSQGKFWLDKIRLRLPLLGKMVLKTEISRLMRTLSLLLSGGIAIIASLDIAISVLENQVLKLEAQKFKDRISGGLSFSRCLNDSKLFPVFVANIITVGEESGTLEKSLLRIADDYEREVDRALKTLARLLEPIIILIMGAIVGFIVLSMLLPIFQINLIVK